MAYTDYCDFTLAGTVKDCDPSAGGVSRVAVAPASKISAITVGADGIITAITTVPADSTPFASYWQKRGVAVATSTFTASDTSSGTYQNDVTFQISKMTTTHRNEFLKLVAGDTFVLYKDNNGTWWLLGTIDMPAEATAADGTTGTALTDYNGYNVTLSTIDTITPHEVEPELAESLIATVAP